MVDYLLKPIEFSRFLQAVNKITDDKPSSVPKADISKSKDAYHFFNVDKRQVKVYHDEILFIESLKEYVRIHTAENTLTTKVPIGELESILSSSNYTRIHKSYIINLDKISAYSASEIEIGDIKLPIGRTYKELVMKQLKG